MGVRNTGFAGSLASFGVFLNDILYQHYGLGRLKHLFDALYEKYYEIHPYSTGLHQSICDDG